MPRSKTTQDNPPTYLTPNRAQDSETAWVDPWQATQEAQKTVVFTRPDFLRDLKQATRHLGTKITEEIDRDPEEVERLRSAIQEADRGQTRPLRRRATKSV
jgi:hypothetical protein